MFEWVVCKIDGHTEETETEYHWDVPMYPSRVSDECMRDGFVSSKWHYCRRCGKLLETENVPTEEAPPPIETAPLL